jgi:LysM repeat protein
LKKQILILSMLSCLLFPLMAQVGVSEVKIVSSAENARTGDNWHIVQQGQTLYAISRIYDVPVAEIQILNGLSDNTIYTGQRILIRKAKSVESASRGLSESASASPASNLRTASTPEPMQLRPKTISIEKNLYYQVKKGDNLLSISDTYEVTPEQIRDWNYTDRFREGDVIIVGKVKSEVEMTPDPIVVPAPQPAENLRTAGNTATERSLSRGNEASASSETFVMPISQFLPGERLETGTYIPTQHDPSVLNTRFYGYHKTLPVGSKVRVAIPDNTGYIEVEIVGQLRPSFNGVIALSPAAVQVLQAGGNSRNITIGYDLPK